MAARTSNDTILVSDPSLKHVHIDYINKPQMSSTGKALQEGAPGPPSEWKSRKMARKKVKYTTVR
jgi:hypothetical protein